MNGTISYAGLVSTALFAVLVFALPITLSLALAYPRLRRRLGKIAPAARARSRRSSIVSRVPCQ